ncbi:hypothetical protein ARSEF4850_007559 [Beauveria asiatica]
MQMVFRCYDNPLAAVQAQGLRQRDSASCIHAPKTRLQLCGEELVHSLPSFCASHPSRPLVLVGHSLGGNAILQAFLYANDDSRYESLQKAVVGLQAHTAALRGSWGLTSRHYETAYWFYTLRNKLSTAIACFSELHETNYGRWLRITGVAKVIVVDETSACILGLDRSALDKDHLKINKYYGPTDPAFERVSDAISEMCRRASDIVRRRFERREIITDNHVALQYNPKAEACLHDLFVIDPLEDKTALKRKKGDRAAGACEWILGTEELTAWLGSRQNPGSESQANQVLRLIGRKYFIIDILVTSRPYLVKSVVANSLPPSTAFSFSIQDLPEYLPRIAAGTGRREEYDNGCIDASAH